MTNSADPTRKDGSPVGDLGWRAVGKLDPHLLGSARSLALNIAQWPARIANSYVTGPTWAERMCLAWPADDDTILTRRFERSLALGLDLATLQLWFLEGHRRVPHTFHPEGRSPTEAEAWILVELLHRGAGVRITCLRQTEEGAPAIGP